MSYRILTAATPEELAEAVMIALAAGWQLTGGVAVSTSGAFQVWAQAMTGTIQPAVDSSLPRQHD